VQLGSRGEWFLSFEIGFAASFGKREKSGGFEPNVKSHVLMSVQFPLFFGTTVAVAFLSLASYFLQRSTSEMPEICRYWQCI